MAKYQGGLEYQTGGASEASALRGKYEAYFEDRIFVPNAEISTKVAFEMASTGVFLRIPLPETLSQSVGSIASRSALNHRQ